MWRPPLLFRLLLDPPAGVVLRMVETAASAPSSFCCCCGFPSSGSLIACFFLLEHQHQAASLPPSLARSLALPHPNLFQRRVALSLHPPPQQQGREPDVRTAEGSAVPAGHAALGVAIRNSQKRKLPNIIFLWPKIDLFSASFVGHASF